jgi:hypothetical protein
MKRRRRGLTWTSVLRALFGLPVLLVLLFLFSEHVHLRVRGFDTYAEMEQSTLHPDWYRNALPATATRIREAHHYDSNEQWMTFSAPASELRRFVRSFRSVSDTSRPRWVHRRLRWWPDELRPGSTTSGDPSGFAYFEGPSYEYTYAVDTVAGRVFAWRRGH